MGFFRSLVTGGRGAKDLAPLPEDRVLPQQILERTDIDSIRESVLRQIGEPTNSIMGKTSNAVAPLFGQAGTDAVEHISVGVKELAAAYAGYRFGKVSALELEAAYARLRNLTPNFRHNADKLIPQVKHMVELHIGRHPVLKGHEIEIPLPRRRR